MIATIAEDPRALGAALAEHLLLSADAARARGATLRIALSGGTTPRAFYEALASQRHRTPWSTLGIYFSDERAVPPDHPDSNFGLAQASWLRHAPRGTAIHRIPGELGAEEAARVYERVIDDIPSGEAVFDIVFLGVGPDGHIASLFPGRPLTEPARVLAIPASGERCARVSLSLATLIKARHRIVLAQGPDKAEVLRTSLAPDAATPLAALLRAAPVALWLDRAAACGLCPRPIGSD